MTDENPTTAVDKDGRPITWKDLGEYEVKDVEHARTYLEDFLLNSYFLGQKKDAQVGPM